MNRTIQWGALTPAQFMSRHWQQRPLLVRQAFPGLTPLLDRAALFDLAGHADVESRLIRHDGQGKGWTVTQGPFTRRQIPSPKTPHWTVLVQGVDLHHDGVSELMRAFRFAGEARLDDLMISYASDGGGVGPHLDNYDVFLLQAHGVREWRIGPVTQARWRAGVPLKLLHRFKPTEVVQLHPGDMLYLPPGYGHDGVAVGPDCMTYSIGFRAPTQGELAHHILQRHLESDETDELAHGLRYSDAGMKPLATPGRIPPALQAFGLQSVAALLDQPEALRLAMGEVLTEPKPRVWFRARARARLGACQLDRQSRMLWDDTHVFLNGEAWRVKGEDARLLRALADARHLSFAQVRSASPELQALLLDWLKQGWLQPLRQA